MSDAQCNCSSPADQCLARSQLVILEEWKSQNCNPGRAPASQPTFISILNVMFYDIEYSIGQFGSIAPSQLLVYLCTSKTWEIEKFLTS